MTNAIGSRKVRSSVSDETLVMMGLMSGTLKKGDYYVRKNGKLLKLFVEEVYPFRAESLGPENTPSNIALYYRNLNDATLKERLQMVAGGIISLDEYISSMGNDGNWDREKFLKTYDSKI